MDDLVMRSVYLRPAEDSLLRQLAHELKATKSDLIRAAISTKLQEWRESNSSEQVRYDLQFGVRGSPGANVSARTEAHALSPAAHEGPDGASTPRAPFEPLEEGGRKGRSPTRASGRDLASGTPLQQP